MKTLFCVLISVLYMCLCVGAQNAPQAPAAVPTPARRALPPEARGMLFAKTGGYIQAKAEGPELLFLNAQTRVPASVIDEPVEQIGKLLRLPARRKDTPKTGEPLTAALDALQDKGVAVVVAVGDTPGYPALLIAPEAHWALVNVAALDGEGVTPETLATRTRKEVWRAFGYLMGAGHTKVDACVMKPVLSTKDLDELKGACLSPELFNQIYAHAQKLGIQPARRTTYAKAVEEGWAPPPTNEIQRAIWEKRKADK